MEIKNTYLFGLQINKDSWTLEDIRKLGIEAQSKRESLFHTDREYILNCLNKVALIFKDKNSHYYKTAFNHLKETITFSEEMIIETMDLIPHIFNKYELSKRMNLEMFFPYSLDVPIERHGYDGLLRAFPKGVVLHVGAGNVFLGILDSLVLGLITKNVNIVKISSSGSYFLNIFAQALKEADERGVLAQSFAVLNWGGGKKELETEILKYCNHVMVWGGYEAVDSYRKMAPLDVKVEPFGPKTSFAIVFESAIENDGILELSRKIVKDCCMWDQSACSNMHTLYLVLGEKNKDKLLKKLFEKLSQEFEYFQKKLPQGKISDDEKVEITKAREIGKIDMAMDKANVMSSFPTPHWTFIYEKDPAYRVSPLNRVLYIKTVKNLDELKSNLYQLKGYLQTVAIAGNILEKKQVMEKFYDLELARFVSLGSMLDGKTGSPHDGIFPMMNLVNWVSLEGRTDNKDKLIEIVKFAREKSAFYKRHYSKVGDVLSLNDFEKLPFLEKSHVLENTPPESADLLTAKARRGIYFASGGSTGQPKYVFYDQHEYEHTCRMLAHAYEAGGLNENDVIANLFVAGNLWSSWLSVEKAIAYTKAISVPTGSNLPIENIVRYLKDFNVNSIIGLPSFLAKLAEYIEEKGIKMPIKKIFYGGEYVGDEMVSFFKRVFPNCIVKSAGYATADAGVIGFQCDKLDKGRHHLFAYSQFIEFVDSKTKKPVKRGEIGELIVTSLNKKYMPIIRYRVGDLGRWVLEPCPCGRKEPVFEILGRCDDRIHVGGAHLFVNDIQNAIGKVPELSFNFQVVIEKVSHKDKLEIKVELKNDKYKKDIEKIENKLYEALYEYCEDLKESVKMNWLDRPKITLLSPNSIERIKRTGKISRVIDKRIKL